MRSLSAPADYVVGGDLYERADALTALCEALKLGAAGRGQIVLVSGEAGVGKTTLMQRFAREAAGVGRVLWGACDPLFTPRPLGPFLDIGAQIEGDFAESVAKDGRPSQLLPVLLRELGSGRAVVVVEDLHWADEASLDLLGLLARRIEQMPIVVVMTFRDDEIGPAHRLRALLGSLATASTATRIRLEPLSRESVAIMAEPHGVDERLLFERTGGNPFFIAEVLASGATGVPPTVRDAVLARAARLGPGSRRLLEVIAITPGSVEFALLEGLAGADLDCLDDCVASGMLLAGRGRVGYRHELAREAIEEAIPPRRRVLLHRAALRALASPLVDPVDPARLAHHAEQANDADAVMELAPVAGERAAAVGAHREAAGQYGRALRFADSVPARHRARLYERYGYECYLCDQPELALEACRQALAIYRALGDRRAEGEALCRLARLQFFASGDAEAEQASLAAVELLESLPPGRELAMAYSVNSYLRMLDGRMIEAIEWGERAVTLASRLGETEVLVFALNSVGAAEASSGLDPQREKLQRSLELSLAAGFNEHAVRAHANLACTAIEQKRYQLADANLADALAFGDEQGIDAWRWYLLALQARSALDRGRWPEAEQTAGAVLAAARPDSCDQLMALVTLAQVRARRGEPGYRPLLEQARQMTHKNRRLPLCAMVAVARAEAAWLEGAWAEVGPLTREWLGMATRLGDPWMAGELAFWRDLAGVAGAGKGDDELAGADVAGVSAEPFRLHLTGDWAGAVQFWLKAGCPYEAALSLASSGQEADLRRALDLLVGLGARPGAAIVARQLRALGARGLPRGPRAATAENPGGLTCRELDVLVLLIEGAPNTEIAARLMLAPKTVEHHVSAILRKLAVGSRREVPAAAARYGLAGER